VLFPVAQPAGAEVSEGCLQHPAKLRDADIKVFSERPPALLDENPAGGPAMSSAVRRLAGSDVATVPALVSLAKDASVSQIVAIGVGLAKAANVCKRKRPDLAERIKDEVNRAGNQTLTTAFAASLTSEDILTIGSLENLGPQGRVLGIGREGKSAGADNAEAGAGGRTAQVEQVLEVRFPRAFFGNGGIANTVVNPVSPAR
jgi:hypothetical protein